MTQPRCVMLAGGGHARVLIDSLRASRAGKLEGILDQDRHLWKQRMQGILILGDDTLLPDLKRRGVTHFVIGLGGVGDNRPRQRLFALARTHGLLPLTVVHPTAICSPAATIGAGSVVFPGAIINAGAVLGEHVIINTGAIVEHDAQIGDHAHISSGATLCGAVRVGALAHIGAGATVRQGIRIGEGAVVGAGASVIDPVEPWTIVAGVPAHERTAVEASSRSAGERSA